MRPAITSRASICLRCEAELLHHFLIVRPISAFRQKRCLFQTSSVKARTQLRYNRNDIDYIRLGDLRKSISENDQNQSKNRQVVGAPKEYIVLRNAARPTRFGQRSGTEDAKASAESLTVGGTGIVNILDRKPGLSNRDEINSNIESLRPQSQHGIIERRRYNSLAEKLRRGFTKIQLWQYIQYLEGSWVRHAQGSANKRPNQLQSPFILEYACWRRGTKDFDTRLEPIEDFPEGPHQHNDKFVLSEYIIRRCWNLEHEEHSEVEGQLEVMIDVKKLDMFMSTSHQMVRNLVDNHQARIETSASEGRVRISGTKDNAEWVIREIDRALQDSPQLEIDTKTLQRATTPKQYAQTVDPTNLDKIASLTSTDIELDKERHRILVRHSKNSVVAAEDARRLILASTDWTVSPKRELISIKGVPSSLQKLEPSSDLSWAQRMETWATVRSQKPVDPNQHLQQGTRPTPSKVDKRTRASVEEYLDTCDLDILKNPRILSAEVELRAHDQYQENGPRWRFNPLHRTSVQFGKILVPAEYSASEMSDDKVASSSQKFSDWTFSTSVPGIFQVASKSSLSNPPVRDITIKLRPFSIMESNFADVLDKAPSLELVLTHSSKPGAPARAWMLNAILESRILGLLLPTAQADLFFEKQSILPFQRTKELASLVEFVNSSQLNVSGKHRLQTPSSITIPIPQKFLGMHSHLSDAAIRGEFDIVDVEYLVAGLEYSERIPFKHNETTFQYVQREGGKVGGRGAYARLARKGSHGKTTPKSEKAPLSSLDEIFTPSLAPFDEFFNKAYDFAHAIDSQIPPLSFEIQEKHDSSLVASESQL